MTFKRVRRKSLPIITILAALAGSCNQTNSNHNLQSSAPTAQKIIAPTANNDSAEILNLLKSVYRWHAKNQSNLVDFDVIVKDSFQVGLNYTTFNKTFSALKQTNYFSTSFADNYKKIADYINNKLTTASPKYLNEINFPSQDADPWTGFQDDFPDFWDKFKITEYKSTKDSASLSWRAQTNDWTSEKYAVGFTKENGKWRVAYLEGFDIVNYRK
jgi:hypothetical protein